MKFRFLFCFFFLWTVNFGQIDTPPVQTDALTKSIAFGWSNPFSFIRNSNKVINENIGIYFDFVAETSASDFLRNHIKFHPSKTSYTLEMNEFLVSIEKGKIIKSLDKFILGHGIGPYYRTNIIRSSVGQGIQAQWNSNYHGFGIQYHLFNDIQFNNGWSLNLLVQLNLGLHQNFTSAVLNSITNEVWEFRTANQQLFSVGVKKKL